MRVQWCGVDRYLSSSQLPVLLVESPRTAAHATQYSAMLHTVLLYFSLTFNKYLSIHPLGNLFNVIRVNRVLQSISINKNSPAIFAKLCTYTHVVCVGDCIRVRATSCLESVFRKFSILAECYFGVLRSSACGVENFRETSKCTCTTISRDVACPADSGWANHNVRGRRRKYMTHNYIDATIL